MQLFSKYVELFLDFFSIENLQRQGDFIKWAGIHMGTL